MTAVLEDVAKKTFDYVIVGKSACIILALEVYQRFMHMTGGGVNITQNIYAWFGAYAIDCRLLD